ncbi:amine oxidase, partial [Francisella tularensis subsp. holarctica]|nr:amine oxidase [Francisella tularensis subsp. holarctica]
DNHINDNREEILEIICERAKKILNIDLDNPQYKTLHTWRYAHIQKQNTPNYFIDINQKIAAFGNCYIKVRVESAFTSTIKLA